MQVQKGFIVGIYNYCDRWCEMCAFTSRCRAFASRAENEAAQDPMFTSVVNAPVLPREQPAKPPAWLTELISAMNARARSSDVLRDEPPAIRPEHRPLELRAEAYGRRVYRWLKACKGTDALPPDDPISVIVWFSHYIPAKVHRAVWGLANADPEDRDGPADHDGSAKAAILAIERSHIAWLELVRRGKVSMASAEPFIADLVRLGVELEGIFPTARAFVRPGLDEPEAMAQLEAQDAR